MTDGKDVALNFKVDGRTNEGLMARAAELSGLLGVRLSKADAIKLMIHRGLTLPARSLLPQPADVETPRPEAK